MSMMMNTRVMFKRINRRNIVMEKIVEECSISAK